MLKISFDFDGTLTLTRVRQLLSVIDKSKAELFIVTSRFDNINNDDVFDIAECMDIPRNNIIFTNHVEKCYVLEDMKIDIHFDNMADEIAMINSICTNTLGFLLSVDIFNDLKDLNNSFIEPIESKQLYLFE